MAKTVIGIRFKKAGKIYYFDPLEYNFVQGDHAVVETVQGVEYGEVAIGPREIDERTFPFSVKPVLRKATRQDDLDYKQLRVKEAAAKEIFEEKVKEHGLDMKLVSVEYTFDKRKAIFSFLADGRVDFRELVKDLAAEFHMRIELRQIGVRDEAKIFDSLGCCGRNTCCSTWLGDFAPVTIKMAKEQNMSLNSTKISGICGRLLCCLNYENEFYKDVTKRMPKVGQMVETPDGIGQIYRLDVLREKVVVKIQNEKEEIIIGTYDLTEIEKSDAPKPVKGQSEPAKEKEAVSEEIMISLPEEEKASKRRSKTGRNQHRDRGEKKPKAEATKTQPVEKKERPRSNTPKREDRGFDRSTGRPQKQSEGVENKNQPVEAGEKKENRSDSGNRRPRRNRGRGRSHNRKTNNRE